MDDAPGGTGRVITPYVTSLSGVKLEAITEESTPFGSAWETHHPTGVSKAAPITFQGFFDDTAAVGPHVVFIAPDDGPADATRTLVVVFGNSKTATMEGYLQSYEVIGKAGGLTEYTAVYQPNSLAWS